MTDLTVILLTYNEAGNIEACLDSLQGLAAPVFVVDSYSTDSTLDILKARNIPFVRHPFENYSRQRNWAQENLPQPTEWVLHLDAGERCTPEMIHWLNTRFDPAAEMDGYMFSRRTIFFDRWIKRGGHYPNFHLRLYRRSKGHCEHKVYDQHFVVHGKKEAVKAGIDIIDTVTDTLLNFTRGHAKWALFEAIEIVSKAQEKGDVQARFFGNPIERRRWLKNKVFQKTPLFLRALLYFLYRYFIRLGFLDGRMGLVFHFLQGGWFRFLVDANVLELRHRLATEGRSLEELVRQHYGEPFLPAIAKKEV